MKLRSIENEANLVNEPTASDLDAASRLGPVINKHLTSLEALCKLVPDCNSILAKLEDLRSDFASKTKLQPNVLESPAPQVQHSSQKSVYSLEASLKTLGKSSQKIDYATVDKIMKDICNVDHVTPNDLHKLFVSSHGGMTPDDFAKAVREKSISETIAVMFDEMSDALGESVWVAITKGLAKEGYAKNEIKESVDKAIIKLVL